MHREHVHNLACTRRSINEISPIINHFNRFLAHCTGIVLALYGKERRTAGRKQKKILIDLLLRGFSNPPRESRQGL